jgi:hypothetical protein
VKCKPGALWITFDNSAMFGEMRSPTISRRNLPCARQAETLS